MRREWSVDASEGREAVAQSLLECEVIGERLGGAFIVMPVRHEFIGEDGSRSFQTIEWRFIHDSFAPAVRAAEPAEEPEPVTVPDEWDEPAAEAE